jgi:hypothetical protein
MGKPRDCATGGRGAVGGGASRSTMSLTNIVVVGCWVAESTRDELGWATSTASLCFRHDAGAHFHGLPHSQPQQSRYRYPESRGQPQRATERRRSRSQQHRCIHVGVLPRLISPHSVEAYRGEDMPSQVFLLRSSNHLGQITPPTAWLDKRSYRCDGGLRACRRRSLATEGVVSVARELLVQASGLIQLDTAVSEVHTRRRGVQKCEVHSCQPQPSELGTRLSY